MKPKRIISRAILTAALSLQAWPTVLAQQAQVDQGKTVIERIVKEGIAVELAVTRSDGRPVTEPLQGEDVVVSLKITDSRTGAPLSGLRPAAWIDPLGKEPATEGDCRQKVQAFLQGSLSARPEVDLNTYFILTLNKESSISVIDPILGYGNSKLFTVVFLKSPGEDWVLTRDKKRLFVTMPDANQVAVIDTAIWQVVQNIDAGAKPRRMALQSDEKYLWVSDESGVTAIDAATLKVIGRIQTAAGRHEMALPSDDQFLFVGNNEAGTVSIIDIKSLKKVRDIETGAGPVSLAYSRLSKALYVANEGDGTLVSIGGDKFTSITRLTLKPGLTTVRFAKNGRWGFVVNQKENEVVVFDSSTNRVIHAAQIGKRPDQISFTDDFAYVRSAATEQVYMIQLAAVGKASNLAVTEIPGGQKPPVGDSIARFPDSIVPAPEGGSVLIANPADQMVYYYTEGMAAPMGSFQNYRRTPAAVIAWNKSLTEQQPGIYSTNARILGSGKYSLAFLLDTPRIVHCFNLTVKPNEAMAKLNEGPPIKIQHLSQELKVTAGEAARVRFKVTDSKTGAPRTGLKDLGVLLMNPSNWQQRKWAVSLGDGIYEAEVTTPRAGVYFLFLQCPSLHVRLNELPRMVLQVKEPEVER
jgi:YVTN family beta-propeller protein